MEKTKTINPLFSKSNNGKTLAESVTQMTCVKEVIEERKSSNRKKEPKSLEQGWKMFTDRLEDYVGIKGQGSAVWLPTEVKKQIEQLRVNSERNIPIRALAAAMIVAFIDEHKQQLNKL